MNRFFKITFSNGGSIAVLSKNGWAGLNDLIDTVRIKENGYIVPISLFEFVKYMITKEWFYTEVV